jgi:hypothetical protein
MWKNAKGGTCSWCRKLKEMDVNEKQQKKGKIFIIFLSLSFLAPHQPYNKINLVQHAFFEDLVLYITKGYHPLSFVDNPCGRRMVLTQHLRVIFPF